jgi:hypothetical protein
MFSGWGTIEAEIEKTVYTIASTVGSRSPPLAPVIMLLILRYARHQPRLVIPQRRDPDSLLTEL